MNKKLNIKKVIICVLIAIIMIVTAVLVRIIVNNNIINKQMETAIHAITINDNVSLYSKMKISKKSKDTFELGTDVYILESNADKDGNNWCKVKSGKQVGYVLQDDLKSYQSATGKQSLMLDVSKFNMQNNFSNMNQFKAFILNNDIKYVYIRAGGRGYGSAGNLYTDDYATQYADACEFLNVPFGFYFLDEALSDDEINEETEFIYNYLNDNEYVNNKLPVALDVEKHAEQGRSDSVWDTRAELVNKLIESLSNKNIETILYSNASTVNQYLSTVNANFWLAYYGDNSQIPDYWYADTDEEAASNQTIIKKMVGWQFTETGVEKTINQNVDLSIVYNCFFMDRSMTDIYSDIYQRSTGIDKIYNAKYKSES